MDEGLQHSVDGVNQLISEIRCPKVVELIQPVLVHNSGWKFQRLFGMAQLGFSQYEEAALMSMTASQLLPNDATIAFAYGNALKPNGQTEGGRPSFERALGIDPNHPGAKMDY